MCGRFTLTYKERRRLADELGVNVVEISDADYKPRYNIAPTDPHWIVRMQYEEREILPAKWGLVNTWAKDAKRAAKQINARSETIAANPAFRDAFTKRRCVVPADGFFEWVGAGSSRQPIWFHRQDGKLILFAGLYESWPASPDNWQRTFTIITTTPNRVVEPVHDRMPVILSGDAVDEWLDPREEDTERLRKLLTPAPEDTLVKLSVSQRVNSVKNDDPSCLEPAEAAQRLL
jgi:putative SOS response-associated peptidase YedK